ncbi:MAG: phenylacetate--CoA ligase family protein [Planctomycetes bacterium]|nr:phenylacetate--CoA ligase family protein [Planctomycetota bacterium]
MGCAWSRKNAWESAPRWLKRGLAPLLGRVPPAWLLGRRFRNHLQFVRDAQWWPRARTRMYQTAQLRRICTLAAERSVFYRRLFREAGFRPEALSCPEDLAAVPMIDKETVRANLPAMCTTPPMRPWVDRIATAGTGGVPLEFYIGADRSAVEFAYLLASWERIGWTLGTPLAVLRGEVVPAWRGIMRYGYDPMLRRHVYGSFDLTDADLQAYLDHMNRLGRFYLHAYPSTAAALARHLHRTGRRAPLGLSGVILESENVYPVQRQMMEDVFGRTCLCCYGQTEKLVLAVECPGGEGYHVWPTYGYLELIDEAGNPITECGRRGQIVGTGFINTVVPFIRYRTGDEATYLGQRCRLCGREHPILADIRGHRLQESLITSDGDEIPWVALNMHDDTFRQVRQFQFTQSTPGRAVLSVVPAAGFAAGDIERIGRMLDMKLRNRIALTVQVVDAIAPSGRGKAIYVDQRIERAADLSRPWEQACSG